MTSLESSLAATEGHAPGSIAGPDEVLGRLGISGPHELYDAVVRRPGSAPELEGSLEAVALPNGRVEDLRAGDLFVRVALGEGHGLLAVLVAGELLDRAVAVRRGWQVEGSLPGRYAQVLEDGAHPRAREDDWARRIADLDGYLPAGHTILRLKDPAPEPRPEITPAEDWAEPAIGEWAASEDAPGRKPVTAGRDENEIVVTRPDGTRFRVRRRIRAQVLTHPGGWRAGFCRDDSRVFLRVAWCEGTQGRIDAGANPQGALKDLLDTTFDQIRQRKSPSEIKQAIENASIRPFLDAEIAKVGDWKFTGDVKIDVNRSGITSKTIGVSGDVGWTKVGVEYADVPGADGGPRDRRVMVTVDIPLSRRTVTGRPCAQRGLAYWQTFDCLREVSTTETVQGPWEWQYDTLFLYFDYAKERLRSDPQSGTAKLNERQLDRLDYLVGRGFRVMSIAGYTSPEGRRGPPTGVDRGAAAKFEGNDLLSRQRAVAVKNMLIKRYSLEGGSLKMRPPVGKLTPVVLKSELPQLTVPDPTKIDAQGRPGVKELEGAALDRAIVGRFLDERPEERARLLPDDRKIIEDRRRAVRDRAERMFEYLRRVEIRLERVERMKPGTINGVAFNHEQECPADVIEAAEREWGSRIPLIKGDPPLCE